MSEDIIVPEASTGERLDVFLTKTLPQDLSRSTIKKMIDNHQVAVNGQPVRARHKVMCGEKISIDRQALEEGGKVEILPENIDLDILFEDDDVLAVNKPEGLLVHPLHKKMGGTLVNALLYHCKTLSDINAPERPGIVHRLDKETSGVILVAKTNEAHRILAKHFEERRIKKTYAAVVKGKMELDEGQINVSIARHPVHFDKRIVSFQDHARSARTEYKVIERIDDLMTRVSLRPQTGRTHQLRVHMKYLGHPILGDEKYGDPQNFPRLALHAEKISFKHPMTGQPLEICAPVPEEFLSPKKFWKS